MITITMKADEKIHELMQEDQDTIGLRVYAKGGRCHGYQYGMSLESTMGEDDTVVEHGAVKVIMDSQSAPLLVGTQVDYLDSMQGSGFLMQNPKRRPPVATAAHSALKSSCPDIRREPCAFGMTSDRKSPWSCI